MLVDAATAAIGRLQAFGWRPVRRGSFLRMGLISKFTGGRREKLDEFLAEHLQPGEQPVAALPMCQIQSGGFADFSERVAFYGISATDRNVYFVGWGLGIPERPKVMVGAAPRESVSIVDYKSGRLTSGKLTLTIEHGEPIEFEIPGLHRADATELVKSLRGTT